MPKYDGHLTISTKIDSSQFDKDLDNIEKKISDFEKNAFDPNDTSGIKFHGVGFDDDVKKSAESSKKLNSELDKTEESWQNISIAEGKAYQAQVDLSYENFSSNYMTAAEQADKLKKETEMAKEEAKKLKEEEKEQKRITEENEKAEKARRKAIEDTTKAVKKSSSDSIRQIGKLALGIFGIRSAYMYARQAASTLSGENKQLANDIANIKSALANVFLPIIETIIKWAKTLMAYVNYIWKALFGKSLFKSGADNLKAGAKSAEKIKNSLQSVGFDEMEILQEKSNKNTDTSVGADKFNLELDNIEIPDWVKKLADGLKPIVDFFQKIIEKYGPVKGGIIAVVGALAGFMILKTIIKLFKGGGKAVSGISADFTGFFDNLGQGLKNLATLGGVSLVIVSLGEVIESVTGLIDTFSESGLGLGEVAGLLGIVLGELAATFLVLMLAITKMKPGWSSIAGAAVIFAGLAAVLLTVTGLIKALSESGVEANEVFDILLVVFGGIAAIMATVALLGPKMTAGLGPFLAVVGGISAVLIVMAATLPTILEAVGDFIDNIAPHLIELIETIGGCINDLIYALGDVLPPIIESLGEVFDTIFNGIDSIVGTVGQTIVDILEAAGGIIKQVGETIGDLADTIIEFIEELGPAIEGFADSLMRTVTKIINFIIEGVGWLVDKINAIHFDVPDWVPVIGGQRWGFNLPKPKPFNPTFLKTGGIINLPNTGVPLPENVRGGEAGAEGVLPLTDVQAMETLGEAIGRYIVINANITNSMNGRVISREIHRIQNQQNFAYNT